MADPTLEELQAELERRRLQAELERRRAERARQRAAAAPPPPTPTPVVQTPEPVVRGPLFTAPAPAPPPVEPPLPAEVVEARLEEAVGEAARAEVQATPPTMLGRGAPDPFERERTVTEQIAKDLEERRGRIIQPGVAEPRKAAPGGITPFFRPTEIRTVQTYKVPAPLEGAGEFVPLDRLPEGYDVTGLETRAERVIPDEETGQFRTPGAWEEFRESFALAPVKTEAEARAEEAEMFREQQIREKGYLGEPPWYDPVGALDVDIVGTAGGLVSGLLEQPEVEGRGIVETGLGAGLRSILGYGSALAAEGYFEGLGYEVDAQGNPVDPDEFGVALRDLREALGIPAVVGVSGQVPEFIQDIPFYEDVIGVDKFGVAIPLPGMATRRRQALPTGADPEGKRAVDPLTEDPRTRMAQAVAKGRTFGDEFMDSPEVTAWFAQNTGDPDHAYLGGLIPELIIPGGPELALGGLGAIAGGLTDMGRVGGKLRQFKALKAADKAADAAKAGHRAAAGRLGTVGAAVGAKADELADAKAALRGGERFGVDPARKGAISLEGAIRDVIRAEDAVKSADEAVAGLRRAVTEGFDPNVARRVATKAAKKAGATADELTELRQVLKSTKPNTYEALEEAVSGVLGKASKAGKPNPAGEMRAKRTMRITSQNLPADYVALTETIAVPRSQLKEARKTLAANRRALFAREPLEKIKEFRRQATALPEGPRKAAALRAADKAEAAGPLLSKAMDKRLDSLARQFGGADAERIINQRPPKDSLRDFPINEELAKYDTWDDVPVELRRQAVVMQDLRTIDSYGAQARLSRDLTRAQIYFRSAEEGIPNLIRNSQLMAKAERGYVRRGLTYLADKLAAKVPPSEAKVIAGVLRESFLNPSGLRRLRNYVRAPEVIAPLYRESLAVARAAEELAAAASTVTRTYGERLTAIARSERSLDRAAETLMEAEVRAAGGSADEAWNGVLDAIWGPQKRERIMTDMVSEAGEGRGIPGLEVTRGEGGELIGEFTEFPTLAQIKSLDDLYVLKGELPGKPMRPSYIDAFTKVGIESGLRKNILANKKTVTDLGFSRAGIEDEINTWIQELVGDIHLQQGTKSYDEAVAAARADFANAAEGSGRLTQLPDEFADAPGVPRISGIPADTFAGRALQEDGDELFRMLDDLPVRQREYISMNVLQNLTTGARDVYTRVKNGMFVPLMVGEKFASQAIVPLLTIGVGDHLRTVGKMSTNAIADATNKLLGRRRFGGGFRAPDGVYYTPKQLEDLANEYGIGMTRLESARVGSLAQDMRRAAQKAAAEGNPANKRLWEALVDESNPLARGFWNNLADSMERNYRKTVFETAIAGGKSPDEAARLARRSQFDYAATPDVLKDYFMPLAADAGFQYMAASTLIPKLLTGKKVNALLKAHREAGKQRDPEGIYGDAAIKSLGFLDIGGKKYMLPANPMFAPIETLIGAARFGDQLADNGRMAYQSAPNAVAGTPDAVMSAFESFVGGGTPYQTQDVPNAAPITDEKMFWSMALAANNIDPFHEAGGLWESFTTAFPHENVPPPEGYGDPTDPDGLRWIRQPPEGIPHIAWRPQPGKPTEYYAFRPLPKATERIGFYRGLDPVGLDRLAPALAVTRPPPPAEVRTIDGVAEEPSRVFTGDQLPADLQEALIEMVLPPVRGETPARMRERLFQVREDTE